MNKESLVLSISCIVKSVDLRPNIVYVSDYDDVTATIHPAPLISQKPLAISRSLLFEANQTLLKQLESAYKSGRRHELEKLWASARPWKDQAKNRIA